MASLNSPVRQKTMITGGREIYVSSTLADLGSGRVGVFKDQELTFGGETADDVYTNFKSRKVTNGDQLNVNFSLHELRPEIMEIIQKGSAIRQTTTNVLIPGQEDIFRFGERALDKEMRLSLFNANNTLVTINSITGSTDGAFLIGALTLGVDYNATVNAFGRTIITLITGGVFTTNEQIITIDYDVTPEASDKFTMQKSSVPIGFFCLIQWRGIDPETNEEMRLEVELENVTNTMSYPALIGDSDEGTVGLPVEFQGYLMKNGLTMVNFD